jgi:hypothetical protein
MNVLAAPRDIFASVPSPAVLTSQHMPQQAPGHAQDCRSGPGSPIGATWSFLLAVHVPPMLAETLRLTGPRLVVLLE